MIFNVNKFLNAQLTTLSVGNRVYPLIAENGSKYPFIVYTRSNTDFNSISKDCNQNITSFDIDVVSDKYADCVDLSEQIYRMFNNKKFYPDVDGVKVTNLTESYQGSFFDSNAASYFFTITLEIQNTGNNN